jgi:hypothetical protein
MVLRCSGGAVSHSALVRPANQDSGFVGPTCMLVVGAVRDPRNVVEVGGDRRGTSPEAASGVSRARDATTRAARRQAPDITDTPGAV